MPVEAENKSVDKTTDLSHRQADGGVAVKSSELRAAADLSIQELIDANEKLRVLLGQIHHYGWEFDLKTHHFLFLDKKCRAKACDCMHQFTPEDLVSNGIVHHKSIQNFRLFIRKLLGGEQNGGATLMLRPFKTEGYTWYSVTYRMLFDSEKQPRKAIGTLSRVNDIEDLPRFVRYGKVRGDLLSSLCAYAAVNLANDEVRKLWCADNSVPTFSDFLSYSDLLESFVNTLFTASAKARVSKTLSLENLRRLAAQNVPHWAFEITRFVENASYIRPVSIHILLDRDADPGDPYAFFYVQYVDKMYEQTGEDYIRCERLAGCGILSESSAEALSLKYYSNSFNQRAHAVIRVYDKDDEKLSAEQFRFIAEAFCLYLEHKAILSALPDNSISIFIPDCESVSRARSEIENAFVFVRKFLPASLTHKICFVASFTQGLLKQLFRKRFLQNALQNCIRLQSERRNDVADFVSSLSEINTLHDYNVLFDPELEPTVLASSDQALSDVEQRLLLKCLDSIVTATNSDASLLRILEILGQYYAADRVYTVRLVDDKHTVEQVCEWNSDNKAFFKGLISGMPLEHFPLFEKVLKSARPVIIDKLKRSVAIQSPDASSETWSYAVYPLRSENFSGLLCIDNPTRQITRTAFPEALQTYLTAVHERVLKDRYDFVSSADLGPNIYRDLSSYQERIAAVSSDGYISMGALVAAVPKMLALENENGPAYCHTLLRFLRELLSRCFANSFIFNPFDQEFVILSPNTTKEVFFDRVTQVRQLCSRSYENQIALGATWSKNHFSGQGLVTEARTIMLSQQDEVAQPTDAAKTPSMPSVHLPISQFTVFYQPKIDMKTKRVIGAEALARGIDDRGTLVPPGRFIGALEREGQLRTLDLFVLSRVLWQITQWKRSGRRLVPVSVNFSRFTLFDHSTVGAVLALLSNYDEVDPALIEIEITETACSVEDETLNHAMKPYQDQGIHFALDDFGTGYANLSIFSKVHFDTIKLDRSLIKDLNSSSVGRSLVESIVQISHDSNTQVIAEGVEEDDQAGILLDRGCHIAQGHLYEKPLDAESFTKKYLSSANA